MSRCKHDKGNIQSFTEICLDCGRNIYETDEEYEAHLRQEIEQLRGQVRKDRISKLEDEKDALLKELGKDDEDNNNGGW